MPEGDTLYNLAALLRPALVGKAVVRLELARLAGDARLLVGTQITAVEARGKNLLIHFDDEWVLHTHLKLSGAWHLYRPGESWRRAPARARVVLEVDDAQAVCFDAPVVRVLKEASLRRDEALAGLGPDLLGAQLDLGLAVSRLRLLADWPLGVALMHQQAVCGIGNVYKSEVLFLEQLDPFQPVSALRPEVLGQALLRARALLQANVGDEAPWRRTTRQASPTEGSKVWVYRRRQQPCFRCGDAVRMKRQGQALRSTYFCPTCQHISADALAGLFAPVK